MGTESTTKLWLGGRNCNECDNLRQSHPATPHRLRRNSAATIRQIEQGPNSFGERSPQQTVRRQSLSVPLSWTASRPRSKGALCQVHRPTSWDIWGCNHRRTSKGGDTVWSEHHSIQTQRYLRPTCSTVCGKAHQHYMPQSTWNALLTYSRY